MNINEIKQQYPSLRKWSDHCAYELYKNTMSEQVVTEFLYTVQPSLTTKQLSKQLGPDSEEINVINDEYNENKVIVEFNTLTKELLDKVNKIMNTFGWYPSFIENNGKYSTNIKNVIETNNVRILYEAKYDVQAKLDDKYLYHVFPDILYFKIQQKGLTPKSKSKISNHPDRIYLLNPTSNDEMEEISYILWDALPDGKLKDSISDYYILQIDTSKLPNHKFFNDPNFYMGNGAVWTYQNIPPSVIKVHGLVTVNPNPIISEGYKTADQRRNQFKEKFNKS